MKSKKSRRSSSEFTLPSFITYIQERQVCRFSRSAPLALPTSKLQGICMSFDEFLFGIALIVSALVSLFMLAFARSFLGFLALVVGAVANYALMLAIAVFAAPYWAFAYSILSLIAGALIEEGLADNREEL
jgi:hypothetical protein